MQIPMLSAIPARRRAAPKNCALDDTIFTGCGKVYVFAPAGGTTESWCRGKDNIVFVSMDN